MKTKDLSRMYYIPRFQKALGADWGVTEYLGHPDRIILNLPGGSGFITVNHTPISGPRWWAPGCGSHPRGANDAWLGVALYGEEPYRGAKWMERMVEDIKKAEELVR